jgi:hypothetical protein
VTLGELAQTPDAEILEVFCGHPAAGARKATGGSSYHQLLANVYEADGDSPEEISRKLAEYDRTGTPVPRKGAA